MPCSVVSGGGVQIEQSAHCTLVKRRCVTLSDLIYICIYICIYVYIPHNPFPLPAPLYRPDPTPFHQVWICYSTVLDETKAHYNITNAQNSRLVEVAGMVRLQMMDQTLPCRYLAKIESTHRCTGVLYNRVFSRLHSIVKIMLTCAIYMTSHANRRSSFRRRSSSPRSHTTLD